MKKYLSSGLVAGAAGGLATAVYMVIIVQPILGDAISLEQGSGPASEALFSRTVQQVGGAVGTVLYGALLGVILGGVLALVRHRLPGEDWQRAVRLAATGFTVVLLVPFLKYPGNPPGVGDPATVQRRTALYLFFVGLSVLAAWSGWRVARTLGARGRPPEVALAVGIAAYVVTVAVAAVLLPGSGDAVPVPAQLVWRFRIASLGGSAILMVVTGYVLGWRLSRSTTSAAAPAGVHA